MPFLLVTSRRLLRISLGASGNLSIAATFISAAANALLAPQAHSPRGISIPAAALAYLWMTGLGTVLLAYAASAASLVARFRSASLDQSTQLKWFAFAGVLIALMALHAGVVWYRGQSPGDA